MRFLSSLCILIDTSATSWSYQSLSRRLCIYCLLSSLLGVSFNKLIILIKVSLDYTTNIRLSIFLSVSHLLETPLFLDLLTGVVLDQLEILFVKFFDATLTMVFARLFLSFSLLRFFICTFFNYVVRDNEVIHLKYGTKSFIPHFRCRSRHPPLRRHRQWRPNPGSSSS